MTVETIHSITAAKRNRIEPVRKKTPAAILMSCIMELDFSGSLFKRIISDHDILYYQMLSIIALYQRKHRVFTMKLLLTESL